MTIIRPVINDAHEDSDSSDFLYSEQSPTSISKFSNFDEQIKEHNSLARSIGKRYKYKEDEDTI